MRRNSNASLFSFYPCDVILERGGLETCCIYSELQVDELDADPPRCAKHDALIGQNKPIHARDVEHARQILRES